jgi:broad specificity phosphatase PhoE
MALPWQAERGTEPVRCEATVEVTESVREWDYGDYEGLTSAEINARRAAAGERVPWDIWADGCPGGE